MAHTFIEHIAGKVLQRIVLTNDPDAHEVEHNQFGDEDSVIDLTDINHFPADDDRTPRRNED